MKLLAVIFLVGLALTSAVPAPSSELSLDEVEELDFLLSDFPLEADDEPNTELGKELRKKLDDILEKIKDSVDNGKTLKEDTLRKFKEIREQMKDLKIDIGNKAKELLKNIKDNAKDYWKKIWDKLTGNDSKRSEEYDEHKDLMNRLKIVYEKVLDAIYKTIENGQGVTDNTVEQLKKLRLRLKGDFSDLDQKAIDVMDKFSSEKGKEIYRKILVKWGIEINEIKERSLKEEIINQLKDAHDEVLELIRHYVEKGKEVTDWTLDKLRDLRGKLEGHTEELDKKARDLMHKLSEKGKERYRKILERLGIEKSEIEERDIFEELRKKMEKLYDALLEQIKEALEKGNEVSDKLKKKLKDVVEKLKNFGVDMNEKAKEFLDKLKDGDLKEKFRKFFEDIGIKKRALETEEITVSTNLPQRLKEKFEEIVRKIKDALENNKSLKDGLEKFKEIRQNLRDLRIELGQKDKQLVKELWEKVKDFYRKFLEKFNEKRSVDYKDLLRKLREKISTLDADDIKAKIEEAFGKGNYISEQLIKMLNDKGGLWRERILKFIDMLIGDKAEKRSIKEVYEKIKNYFKDLQIELKEKFVKFGEWAKDKFEKGLEKGQDKVDNLKKLAREFINDTKVISKDVAEQAKEFFREHKEDIGTIYDDVSKKIREILNKE